MEHAGQGKDDQVIAIGLVDKPLASNIDRNPGSPWPSCVWATVHSARAEVTPTNTKDE